MFKYFPIISILLLLEFFMLQPKWCRLRSFIPKKLIKSGVFLT